MLSIVVGGQISKDEILKFIQEYLKDIELKIIIKGDLDAVNLVKKGEYQYYVGACNTGGGGALAMAMALLGRNKCQTISMPGKVYADEDIRNAVNEGKIAFGFTAQHFKQVLPVLLDSIRVKEGI
jgi:hypothetical protein